MKKRYLVLCRLVIAVLGLGLVGGVVAESGTKEKDPPPGVGVWTATVGGLRVIEVVLPESPLAAAPWPGEGGGLAVLTRPVGEEGEDPYREDLDGEDKAPRALYRVRGSAEDLVPVARDLPPGLDALERVGDRLWLGEEGKIWCLEEAGLVAVLELPGLDLAALERSGLIDERSLWVPDVGSLRHYRLGDRPGDHPELVGEQVLPVSAERRRRHLLLRSPSVTRLPGGQLIAGPEAAGTTRVRHHWLGEGESPEAWSRLPGPEEIEAFWYAEHGGKPVFLAATTEADRLGIFEKLKLRIFPLGADRTRAGRSPLLAIESETKNWYRFEPLLLDADRDGASDLVLIQPQGMGPGDLVIDIYKGLGSRFSTQPRRTKLDAESARWFFGEDLDGDGAPDLVVGTDELSIYRGLADHRRRAVDKDPWRRLDRTSLRAARKEVALGVEVGPSSEDRPSFRGRQRVADVDADGRPDLAVVRPFRGRTVVRLVSVAEPLSR